MIGGIITVLLILIERITQIVKTKISLNPIYISMIVGTALGIPAGFALPELGSFFASLHWGWLLLCGAIMGLALSLPANILHDIWSWIKVIGGNKIPKEIEKLINQIMEQKEK